MHFIEAILESGLSVRHAAEEYRIPKSTLADRVSGRRLMGCRSGPPRLLSNAQEESLVKFLLRCSTIGYAKSKKDGHCYYYGNVQVKKAGS